MRCYLSYDIFYRLQKDPKVWQVKFSTIEETDNMKLHFCGSVAFCGINLHFSVAEIYPRHPTK